MGRSGWAKICLVCGLLLLVAGALLSRDLYQKKQAAISNAKEVAQKETIRASAWIGEELNRFVPLIHSLADELSSGELLADDLVARLEGLMDDNPALFAVGAAFEPFAANKDRRLFGPYLMRRNGTVEHLAVEDFYDYSDGSYEWYTTPLTEGARWDEPVWGEASEALMATYSVPFYRLSTEGMKVVAGVVYISYSLDRISEWVTGLDLGKTGWAVAISGKGTIIAHPDQEVLQEQINVTKYAKSVGDKILLDAAEKMLSSPRGDFDLHSLQTGKKVWFIYNSIPMTDWKIGVIRVKSAIDSDRHSFRKISIWAYLFFAVSILLISASYLSRHYPSRPHLVLWVLVAILTTEMGCGIGFIRFLTLGHMGRLNSDFTMVVDNSGLKEFLGDMENTRRSKGLSDPIYVPTGVFVQTMEFNTPHNIFVTGYVWQKYPAGTEKERVEGFSFPEAISSSIDEIFRRRNGETDIIGWSFEATLRQNMDYSKYPFDNVDVWLRMWHKDFHNNKMLVPDMDSYPIINPETRPGLDKEFLLPGWTVTGSFFSFRKPSYNTSFGIPAYLGTNSFHELFFNISMQRNLLDAVIMNIIPLSVVSLMLFALLVTTSSDPDLLKSIGFAPSKTLRVTSSLFFVILLAHIHLRTTVTTKVVMYLEYYYFVMYFLILYVSMHSFVYLSGKVHWKPFIWEDGLVIKLLFWPVLIGSQLLATIIVFY